MYKNSIKSILQVVQSKIIWASYNWSSLYVFLVQIKSVAGLFYLYVADQATVDIFIDYIQVVRFFGLVSNLSSSPMASREWSTILYCSLLLMLFSGS